MGEGEGGLGISFPLYQKIPQGGRKKGFGLEKSYRFGKKNFKLA